MQHDKLHAQPSFIEQNYPKQFVWSSDCWTMWLGWYSLYSGVLLEVGVGNNTVLFQYKFIYMTVDHVIN